MARRPREPGQAEQAKFRHRGAPLETFHTFPAGSRMGVVPFSGFVTLEASPNPVCQPLGHHAPGPGWGSFLCPWGGGRALTTPDSTLFVSGRLISFGGAVRVENNTFIALPKWATVGQGFQDSVSPLADV